MVYELIIQDQGFFDFDHDNEGKLFILFSNVDNFQNVCYKSDKA